MIIEGEFAVVNYTEITHLLDSLEIYAVYGVGVECEFRAASCEAKDDALFNVERKLAPHDIFCEVIEIFL